MCGTMLGHDYISENEFGEHGFESQPIHEIVFLNKIEAVILRFLYLAR